MTENLTPPVPHARKAKGEGHLRYDEILKAAERIFLQVGYDATTMRKISDAVGMSSAGLYVYFPDKDAIVLEICKTAFTRLGDATRACVAASADPVDRARMMLQAYVRFGLENPATYALAFSAPRRAGLSTQHKIMAFAMESISDFRIVIDEIEASGRLKGQQAITVRQSLGAACHGLVSLVNMAPGLPWAPIDSLVGSLIEGLFNGFIGEVGAAA